MRKSQQAPLLLEHNDAAAARLVAEVAGGGSEQSYSSNSSFSDTYSDSSDLANWEEYVADDGTLFYAEYMPQLKKIGSATMHEKRIEFTRNSSLRMGKKAARRQQQQSKANGNHPQQQQQPPLPQQPPPLEVYRFSHIKPQQQHHQLLQQPTNLNYKQLELVITAADRFRFGRRSTAIESILGFRVLPFPDQRECLMVDSFVHDMPALQGDQGGGGQSAIKRGDWFKSLDEIEIRAGNVDELLLQFIEPTTVTLKFQGPAADVAPADQQAANADHATAGTAVGGAAAGTALKKLENFEMFAQVFEQLLLPEEKAAPATTDLATAAVAAKEIGSAMPFAMLILPPECYQNDEHKDSLYYYPENAQTNFLYKTRGSFLTLNAVLTEELQTKPFSSRLLVAVTPSETAAPYYVSYRSLNGFLVLFAYAVATCPSLAESNQRSDELIAYMRFAFPQLNLESFAASSASAEPGNLRRFLHGFCEVQRTRLLAAHRRGQGQFEELLHESRHIPLPKEAQLRIFDALSEMEAMDYRNWNDEPLNTHREFFIYGSVLYYNCFMLASQMPVEVRANVECFLRCRGIFDFIAEQSVRELYVWEEIELPDATGRYYLTVCSRSHLLLAVILKIFDAPDDQLAPSAIIPPSLFYIEEIQETLDHLIQCGIESLAMFWSVSNKRPEVLDKMEPPFEATAPSEREKESRKLDTFIKQKLTTSTSAASTAAGGNARSSNSNNNNNDEEAHLCSSLGGSSIHSLTPSEDDSSKKRVAGGGSVAAHAADDGGSDSGGSDWDHFAEQNPLHYSLDADTQSQMTESLWKEINNVVPVKISAGWKNSVFYYVYVDSANGSVFCPLKANSESFPFLREMRKACHVIHKVLRNTKSFRRLLAQESSKSTSLSSGSSKGMLAIKEHGITMQVRDAAATTEQDAGAAALGAVKGSFVVVGRLFFSPTKEVYVCHRPDVPQNMVEMAFRLSFFSVG